MNRRELLASGKSLLALLAGLGSVPTLYFWWRSARLHEDTAEAWADLGPPGKIPEGSWQGRTIVLRRLDRWQLESREEAVYVRREGDKVEVLSAVCPHTGCLVRRQGEGFDCPCHRSRFDAEGRNVEGPSPRPLDRLQWKIERSRLVVRYQRFRPGLGRPEPLDA